MQARLKNASNLSLKNFYNVKNNFIKKKTYKIFFL